MTEASKQWEGQIVEGIFPLRQYLGGSEQSAVFLTEHGDGERQKAAIKLVPADPANADLQIACWQAAAQLSHPNLLKLLDGGRCKIDGNDLLYLVMEYAEENLSQILPERALTPEETRDMLGPVLDALEYLHGKGFVHGDVKPANILAIGDKLKLSSDTISRMGQSQGVPKKAGVYDPPEAISGMLTPAGDVWSLGTTLVEVLTQRLPDWQPGPHREPVVPATLPAPFLEIAKQALRLEPQRRSSIADIAARLNSRAAVASAAGAGSNVSVSAVAAPPPPVVLKPVVSQAVPPRPAPRVQPSPRPPRYNGEARPKSRFIAPLIAGAVVFALILIAPRLLTHRPAAQPAVQKAVSSTAASSTPNPKAKAERETPPRETAPAIRATEEKPGRATPQPPSADSLKTTKAIEPPAPAVSSSEVEASDAVAKPATPGSGSAKGEVLDQILPDVSQKARDTIQGKVRVIVKVHVDPAGAVSEAELDSPGPSKYFADQALQAAKRWAFTPPEVGGKSVASEWRIQFDFRQKETKVIPTQTAP